MVVVRVAFARAWFAYCLHLRSTIAGASGCTSVERLTCNCARSSGSSLVFISFDVASPKNMSILFKISGHRHEDGINVMCCREKIIMRELCEPISTHPPIAPASSVCMRTAPVF
jgi:hypothetical protein